MAMEGSVEDLGAPESWEVADLDESMNRLLLSSKPPLVRSEGSAPASAPSSVSSTLNLASALPRGDGSENVLDDAVNQVDQFLREALQNPRERLSILRMEQDVEKFIRDPTQHQLEFQQLPTSYLRLAAHRVAQHYSLQSMVLLDNSLPDGSGSRIIVRKTSECQLPLIRLADIPANIPSEDNSAIKVAIKQRPSKRSQIVGNAISNSSKAGNSKSVEERKEEYNRARARIFNSTNNIGGGMSGKPESEARLQDNPQHGSLGISKMEEKSVPGITAVNSGGGLIDSSTSSSRSARIRTEKEPIGRIKPNSKVAIFRDREVDRKDPDYDRSYDRYTQRFDPGFGFNGGPYTMQPMYTPAVNYNTEFPQLGSTHRPQISPEHQPHPLPQHLPGAWGAPSTPTGIGYGHPETMMAPFNPNHVGARSTSAIYLHSSQYPCQHPGMPFIHTREQVHQSFSQSHQQQPDASFGLARPR
ncbi:hypothetical protein I3843_14G034100 [Carya illinoinensis]|uniref:R3H domain-containing protein 2-like n=2 Tax=Carya illinoinensis TaxID=32201 RepID=A0A922AIV5_CARIL|nr:cAMP-regulated phosphoprotein 21-like isoform X2 [Carya illinoinensis]KAG6677588.1 hypothetical protein I3842_14G035000 [Carya illinoinensis]KAG6677589.1 hypothetical protein I3842_14G035000 [Carya illinoinensis]KAG7946318.1 hypothetical protein I3843_14G034100 [Carya illinoinensis]KAG7946320.1 hypothetical protein I3843_14G034100 [Carya illinoinensis]